jgi:transposase
MGRAIAVRTDYTSGEVRRVAQRVKNAGQARRLLAIAAALDGALREDAAKIGGMDRQTLRDWVIRFNEQGPEGLINKSSPGAPGKLTDEHKAFLARIVEEGPIPAVHGVVRWRACDLIMRMQLHLDEIATKVTPGAHAIVLLDQAGWHGAKALKVPSNLSLMPLPPRAPELNGQENIWQFMRQNWLSNRVFKSFDDIVDHCCYAWNTLIDQPWKIMSIANREWATVGQSL